MLWKKGSPPGRPSVRSSGGSGMQGFGGAGSKVQEVRGGQVPRMQGFGGAALRSRGSGGRSAPGCGGSVGQRPRE